MNVNKKFTDTNIRVNCRFSYAHVLSPRVDDRTGEKKYACCLLIDKKDTEAVKLVEDAVEAAKALYKERYGRPSGKLKTVAHDGDEERPDNPNYAGLLYINASSKSAPGVKVLESGVMVDALDDNDFYSGCYGAADINFYPFNKNGAFGISCGLNNVIKLKDGEKLAGGMSADDAFSDLA